MPKKYDEKTIVIEVANVGGEIVAESGETLLTNCVIGLDTIAYRVRFWTEDQGYRDVTELDVIEERFEAYGIDATESVSEKSRKAIFEKLRERIYDLCESELVG